MSKPTPAELKAAYDAADETRAYFASKTAVFDAVVKSAQADYYAAVAVAKVKYIAAINAAKQEGETK